MYPKLPGKKGDTRDQSRSFFKQGESTALYNRQNVA